MKTNKLIQIYFYVCDLYNTELRWEVQKFSSNNDFGKITDEELITNYWKSWFPNYQNFNSIINRIASIGVNGK